MRDAAGEPPDRLHLLRLAVLPLELSQLRDIRRDRQYSRDPSRGIMQRRNGETDVHQRPVFPASRDLHPPQRFAPQHAVAQARVVLQILADGRQRTADDLRRLPAIQRLGRAIPRQHRTRRVERVDREWRALNHGREMLVGLSQRTLRPLVTGRGRTQR